MALSPFSLVQHRGRKILVSLATQARDTQPSFRYAASGTEFETTFEMPTEYIKVPDEETTSSFFVNSTNKSGQIVEYDIDSEDEDWIRTFNKKATDSSQNIPIISVDIFERVFDSLEKISVNHECHSCSVEFCAWKPMAHNLPSGDCAVCKQGCCEDANEIVYCDGCNIGVHQWCYGLSSLPSGYWLCKVCAAMGPGAASTILCALCGDVGGAFMTIRTDGQENFLLKQDPNRHIHCNDTVKQTTNRAFYYMKKSLNSIFGQRQPEQQEIIFEGASPNIDFPNVNNGSTRHWVHVQCALYIPDITPLNSWICEGDSCLRLLHPPKKTKITKKNNKINSNGNRDSTDSENDDANNSNENEKIECKSSNDESEHESEEGIVKSENSKNCKNSSGSTVYGGDNDNNHVHTEKCVICNSSRGYMAQCASWNCLRRFHVTCGQKHPQYSFLISVVFSQKEKIHGENSTTDQKTSTAKKDLLKISTLSPVPGQLLLPCIEKQYSEVAAKFSLENSINDSHQLQPLPPLLSWKPCAYEMVQYCDKHTPKLLTSILCTSKPVVPSTFPSSANVEKPDEKLSVIDNNNTDDKFHTKKGKKRSREENDQSLDVADQKEPKKVRQIQNEIPDDNQNNKEQKKNLIIDLDEEEQETPLPKNTEISTPTPATADPITNKDHTASAKKIKKKPKKRITRFDESIGTVPKRTTNRRRLSRNNSSTTNANNSNRCTNNKDTVVSDSEKIGKVKCEENSHGKNENYKENNSNGDDNSELNSKNDDSGTEENFNDDDDDDAEFKLNTAKCCNGIDWNHVRQIFSKSFRDLPLSVLYSLFCLWRYKRCKQNGQPLIRTIQSLDKAKEIELSGNSPSLSTNSATSTTTKESPLVTTIAVVFTGYEDWNSMYLPTDITVTNTTPKKKRRRIFTPKKKVKKKLQDNALKTHCYLMVPVLQSVTHGKTKKQKKKK